MSELVWASQLYVTFAAMLRPGLIEVVYPFLGEILFLNIMLLLVHPKVLMAAYVIVSDMIKGANQDLKTLRDWTQKRNLNPGLRTAVIAAAVPLLVAEFLLRGMLEFIKSTSMYLVYIVLKPVVFTISFLRYAVAILYGINMIQPGGRMDKFLKTLYTVLEWTDMRKPNPATMSWVVAGITEINFPYFTQLWTVKLPFTLGLATALLFAYPYIGFPVATGIIFSVIAGMIYYGIRSQFLPDKPSGERHDEYVITGNMIEAIVSTGILLAFWINLLFLSTFLPMDLIKRASPIFITSFLFAAGISWLSGLNLQKTEDGKAGWFKSESSTRIATAAASLAAIAGALALAIPPVSEWIGNSLLFVFTQTPSADGSFTTPPIILNFSESLRLPWIFALFFNIILGGSLILGTIGTVAGALTNLYLWFRPSKGKAQENGPQQNPPTTTPPTGRAEVRAEESNQKVWMKRLGWVGGTVAALLIAQAFLRKGGEEEKKSEPPPIEKKLPVTIYRGGNWQVVGEWDKGPTPVELYRDKKQGYTQIGVYHNNHQAFAITGSGYIRPVTRGKSWGPSIMTAGAWVDGKYDHNLTIQNVRMGYNGATKALVITAELRDRRGLIQASNFSIVFPTPADDSKKVEADLHYTLVAQKPFQFDQDRLEHNGPFRPLQVVSMNVQGGKVFDSNQATVRAADGKVLAQGELSKGDSFVFAKPPVLSRGATFYLENTAQGGRNTPTVYVTPMNLDLSRATFQIWNMKSDNVSDDNIGAWFQWVSPTNPQMQFGAGQEIGSFDFTIGAISEPKRSEVRAPPDYEKFVAPELTLKAHTEKLNPNEEKSVHEKMETGLKALHQDIAAKDGLVWLGDLLNKPGRPFGEILDGFKNFFADHGYPHDKIEIQGAAWNIGQGQYATFGQHRDAIFEAAKALAAGNVEELAKRFEPNVNRQAVEEGIRQMKAMLNGLSDRQKALLEIAIAVHDIGRYVSTGPRHPTLGGHLVPGLLEGLKNKNILSPAEVQLITALTSRELDYGSLHWGETTPFKLLEGLEQEGVDPKVFLPMLSIIAGFLDPGSVPRGSLDQMGRLTPTHTDNAVFLSQPENIDRLEGVWAERRWTGLRLPGRETLPLTKLDQDNAFIPAEPLRAFGENHPEFSNNMTLQRMVLALRKFDDQTLLTFLNLTRGLYNTEKIDFVGFSTDRWEEESGEPVVKKFYDILKSIPQPETFFDRGGRFELDKEKNLISARDDSQVYGFGTFLHYPADNELVINTESWVEVYPAEGEGPKRAEVRKAETRIQGTARERLFQGLREIHEGNVGERQRATLERVLRRVDENRIARALDRAVEKLALPATTGTANLKGELVVNYHGVQDDAAVAKLLTEIKTRSEVRLYVFDSASPADWNHMEERFARQLTEVGQAVVLVDNKDFGNVESFVRFRARERQMTDERGIIQIMTESILKSPKERDVIQRAWTEALSVAEGKRTIVVVGADRRIGNASVVTLLDILQASFEVMQAVKASA